MATSDAERPELKERISATSGIGGSTTVTVSLTQGALSVRTSAKAFTTDTVAAAKSARARALKTLEQLRDLGPVQ